MTITIPKGPLMTQKELFAAIKALGMSVRKTGHGAELRVAFSPMKHDEPSAYYTDDRQDALDTAQAMIRARTEQILATRVVPIPAAIVRCTCGANFSELGSADRLCHAADCPHR